MSDAVRLERPSATLAHLVLNRPGRANAMNDALIDGLHGCFDELEADSDCRVVIISGAGKAFCAGLDLDGYGAVPRARGDSAHDVLAVVERISLLLLRMRRLPQVFLAAVNGAAVGGGLSLVLGSDLRLASTEASFGAAFLRAGVSNCDIGTSWLLPRLIGAARAQELMLSARTIDAAEAHEIGLVSEVVGGDVVGAAEARAARLLEHAPLGLSLTKQAMWTALELPALSAAIELENRQQTILAATADHAEAVAAFRERRPPRYGAPTDPWASPLSPRRPDQGAVGSE